MHKLQTLIHLISNHSCLQVYILSQNKCAPYTRNYIPIEILYIYFYINLFIVLNLILYD